MDETQYYTLTMDRRTRQLRDWAVQHRQRQIKAEVKAVRTPDMTPESVAEFLGYGLAAVLRAWD